MTSGPKNPQRQSAMDEVMIAVSDFASEPIIIYEPGGRVQYWNDAASRVYGWPARTTVGHRLDPLAEREWLPWSDLGDHWSGEVERRRLDGSLVAARVRVLARRDAGGCLIAYVEYGGLSEPLTRAPVLSDLLLEDDDHSDIQYSDRFRRLLEYMPIALWQVDARSPGQAFEALKAQGITDIRAHLEANPDLVSFANDTVVVRQVNRAAMQFLGGDREEQFLRPVRYIFEATPEAAISVMVNHFEGQRTHIQEMKINTFDGRVLDVLLLVTYPRPPEDLATTFISMVDITDRRLAEAELRQLHEDFAHAARVSMLGEMVTSIAHEVKQPLAAIVTNGEASLRWLQRDGGIEKARPLLDSIVFCANQANDIIRRIQALASKHETIWSELLIDDVIAEAIQVVLHDSREKGVTIELRLNAPEGMVRGDRVQIQQVVVNLVVNSLQAIAHANSGVRQVTISTEVDGDLVRLSVEDSGPGLDDADLGQIFDGFFTTKAAGMGMGLTICRSILVSHGGDIEARNRSPAGAEMQVWIPLYVPSGGDAANTPNEARPLAGMA